MVPDLHRFVLVDGILTGNSYPVPDVKHLHSAAVLAASKHGDWQAAQRLIRKRAKELGVDVNTLPGFGSGDTDKVAAAGPSDMILALVAKASGGFMHPSEAMHHGPFQGQHTHPHTVRAVMNRPHFHNGDSTHDHMHVPE